MANENTLAQLRSSIDRVDQELLRLLEERMEVVRQVGELKRKEQSTIYRPEREQEIIARLSSQAKVLDKAAISAIYQEIFAISRNLELPERVGFLGPEGSFTHQAAESRFGATSEYLPQASIRRVFEAVATGQVRYGVVPIENNQEGIVAEAIDMLGSMDLKIVAEVPMPIHFCFASMYSQTGQIQRIFSKDIAFSQCRKFLEDVDPEGSMELIPVNSTSKAARLAKSEPHAAAICSHIAAKAFELPVVFDNIEDSADNFTRFLILAQNWTNQAGERNKTSVLLRTDNEPGALAQVLQDFFQAGINLTKIESRPAKEGSSFKSQFFIDFEGHKEDPAVSAILEKYAERITWLGSYILLC